MILSHIDSNAISGAYIGYPHCIGESFAPKGIDYSWYYFKVNRNSESQIVSVEIFEAQETFKGFGLAIRDMNKPMAIINREQQFKVLNSGQIGVWDSPVSELGGG